jgi:hypothetical protein
MVGRSWIPTRPWWIDWLGTTHRSGSSLKSMMRVSLPPNLAHLVQELAQTELRCCLVAACSVTAFPSRPQSEPQVRCFLLLDTSLARLSKLCYHFSFSAPIFDFLACFVHVHIRMLPQNPLKSPSSPFHPNTHAPACVHCHARTLVLTEQARPDPQGVLYVSPGLHIKDVSTLAGFARGWWGVATIDGQPTGGIKSWGRGSVCCSLLE